MPQMLPLTSMIVSRLDLPGRTSIPSTNERRSSLAADFSQGTTKGLSQDFRSGADKAQADLGAI
jgi:hypothetical protein